MNYSCELIRIDLRTRFLAGWLASLALLFMPIQVTAQTITSVQPRTAKPGQTTQLVVVGTDLNDSLKLASNDKSVDWKVDKIEPTQATQAVTLPSDSRMGPLSLWLTTATGVIKSHTLFVDDLDAVIDNGNNHAKETAQSVSTRSTIEGICDASASDFYRIHAARSLGSPTLLQMQLFTAAGAKVAGTTVTDTDEWSFDATFPENGDYRLEVTDLLKRGGDELTYYIECAPAGTFTVALKAVAATREEFMIEPGNGACAIDLRISRFGFDGEIDLAILDSKSGLQILNPRIPAKAAEAKIYVRADTAWKPDSLKVVQFSAVAVDNPETRCVVDSVAIRRVKEPHVIAPTTLFDGSIVLAATTKTESPFSMEPIAPVQFARPIRSHSVALTPKRMQAEFKAGVDVLSYGLVSGWSLNAKVDKESYALTRSRCEQVTDEPKEIPLMVFGDWNGHGRIETYNMPIQWIDPLRVEMTFSEPFVRGGRVRGTVKVLRQGSDPQPVSASIASYPVGISGPATIAIAADQASADIELQIAADATLDASREISMNASSKYTGQDYTVTSSHALPVMLESPSKLNVYPNEIVLSDSRSRQQLAVSGGNDSALPRDWTRQARMSSANPQIAEVRNGVVYPIADGKTEVIVEVGGNRQVIPVQVANMATSRKVD